MDIGMLWYDPNKKHSFEDKIREAAKHYQTKYGKAPNLCITRLAEAERVDGVTVRTDLTLQNNHFWIGVEKQTESSVQLAF
jgi:hypothetical protein